MTDYFMIFINADFILRLYLILERPVKDYTTNKDSISNMSKFIYIHDPCLKIHLFIPATGIIIKYNIKCIDISKYF